MLENRTIYQGDVLERLKDISENSVDCVITSPPYWYLRDYGVEGQWGLEKDFHDYLKKMQVLMNSIRRVLKTTGTVWINLGDTYGCNGGKSRFGIPERFYTDCIDNKWIARNHIPWIKGNPMPFSGKDRFTNKWESIFLFAKEPKYFFDLDAVKEKTLTETKPFNLRIREAKKGMGQLKLGDSPKAWKMTEEEDKDYNSKGERKQDLTLGADGKPKGNYKDFNERYKKKRKEHDSKQYIDYPDKIKERREQGADHDAGLGDGQTKNPGDIFNINPKPFPDAHFATFPIELPLKILKCACPKDGIVLDPFFGAGTVGVAAEQLGLKWIGIELNPKYIEIATKRLEPFRSSKLF